MSGFMNRIWKSLASTVALITPAIAAAPTLASPDPAALLPADVAYTIRLDMREATWEQLNQYALFQQLQVQAEDWSTIGGLPYLSIPGLEYDTFIAPWVADTTAIALLPVASADAANVIADREILIAPIAHPEIFAAQFEGGLISQLAALKQQAPQTATYQGVEIFYWEPRFFEEDAPQGDVMPETPTPPAAPSSGSPRPVPAPSQQPALEREPAPAEALKVMPKNHAEMDAPPIQWLDVPGLAIAVFPDFLVVAANPAAIRAWVDLRPGEGTPTLADNAAFQRLLANPHYDEAFGALYGNFAELMQYPLTELSLPELPFNLPLPWPEAIALPDSAQLTAPSLDSTIEVLIYPQAQGLRLQGRGYYDRALLGDLDRTIPAASTATLSYLPQDSYGMISGQNLAGIWQQATTTLEATAETRALLEQVRGFFTAFTGLDLDRDVFGWMDQGFTLFLYPTDQTPLTAIAPELRVGFGIALQTSDRATATATFATFDELIKEFSITVEPTTLNGQAATSWGEAVTSEESASFLGRTWANDDTLLLTTGIDALATLTQLDPAQTLPNNLRFIASTHDFPTPNQGYVFANTAPMRSLLYSLFPPGPDPTASLEFRKLFASVQAVSGTLSFQDEYAQIDGMLLLAPAEGP